MEDKNHKIQRTFVAIKPDGIYRSILGKIISRFEDVGLKLVGMKMVWANEDMAKQHYVEHIEKPFYETLEKYLLEGPIVIMAIEGVGSIDLVRKMVGYKEPHTAPLGTIRGDYAHASFAYSDSIGIAVKNLIHASANSIDAEREIKLWFNENELFNHVIAHDKLLRNE